MGASPAVPCGASRHGRMTYCVGVKLDEGLIFASDSRTHAGVDNYATFCKMSVFERPATACWCCSVRAAWPPPRP